MHFRCHFARAKYAFSVFVCFTLPVTQPYANECSTLLVNLHGPVKPPYLSLSAFSDHQAEVGKPFQLDLTPYLTESNIEISYQLTHQAHHQRYRSQLITDFAVYDVPFGLVPVSDRPDSCQYGELAADSSCVLHYVLSQKDTFKPQQLNAPKVAYEGHCKIKDFFHTRLNFFRYAYPDPAINVENQLKPLFVKPKLIAWPLENNGLSFNPMTWQLKGTPKEAGIYEFEIHGQNPFSVSKTQILRVNVGFDIQYRPVFQKSADALHLKPNEKVDFDLTSLLDDWQPHALHHDIRFKVDANTLPNWLKIDEKNGYMLKGVVPQEESGKRFSLNLKAYSNIGGDSSVHPLLIDIAPEKGVAPDLMQGIIFYGRSATTWVIDFEPYMHFTDDTRDAHVVIDSTSPEAEWLSKGALASNKLKVDVPAEAWDRLYDIKAHVESATLGRSTPVSMRLYILPNMALLPKLAPAPEALPPLAPAGSYQFDLRTLLEVSPSYEAYPYHIQFAKGFSHPSWIRISNNILYADVPAGFNKAESVYITLQNEPGGVSQPYPLILRPSVDGERS